MAFNFLNDLLTSGNRIVGDADDSDESDFEPEMLQDPESDLSLDRDESASDSDVGSDDANIVRLPDQPVAGLLWSDTLQPVQVNPFTSQSGPVHTFAADDRPIDYFYKFIPEQFFEHLAKETNRYAEQKQANQRWSPATSEEMKIFVYVNIMFGIHTLPQLYMYWSTDKLLHVPAVSDAISRDRYMAINSYLHLNDNDNYVRRGEEGHDPLFKIRPLHDIVLKACQENFKPSREISFDEAMIAFKGRLYFKQYIQNKPNPWGVKVWCAAESASGYLLKFSFYTGKENDPKGNGLGYNVVMDLGKEYLGKFHHFFYDNFFSSVKLAEDLLARDTYACSTIRTNRKGWPQEMKKKKGLKKDTVIMKQRGNLVASLWQDKRTVCMLSTNSAPDSSTAQRRTKEGLVERSIPNPILSYNENMGGVDLNDQLRSYYPIGRQSKKWWRCTLWYLFEVAAVNSYLLYKATITSAGQKPMTHLQFHLEIARELLRGNVCRSRRSKEFPSPSGLGRAAPEDHVVARLHGRKRQCFQCRTQGNKTASQRVPETVFGCTTCQIHLCKGTCFAAFHNKLN